MKLFQHKDTLPDICVKTGKILNLCSDSYSSQYKTLSSLLLPLTIITIGNATGIIGGLT
jgi:hypothetical protein